MAWVFLAIAIVSETFATLSLKASQGFVNLEFAALSAVGYIIAGYCFAMVLKSMHMGVAYAIWAGVGISIIAAVGAAWYGQKLDVSAIIGMSLINIAGVVLSNISAPVSH